MCQNENSDISSVPSNANLNNTGQNQQFLQALFIRGHWLVVIADARTLSHN